MGEEKESKQDPKSKDHKARTKQGNFISDLYDRHYKALMIFSMVLLVFSVGVIGYKYATTGDIVERGVTLKGGMTLTLPTEGYVDNPDPDDLQASLKSKHLTADISVRSYGEVGSVKGLEIEATDITKEDLVAAISEKYPQIPLSTYENNVQVNGPSLGGSFFIQMLKGLFIAFTFMSLVIYMYFGDSTAHKWIAAVFSIAAAIIMFYASSAVLYIIALLMLAGLMVMYFRTSIPSFGILLCAISNTFFALAIFNLAGFKLNTAGVVAFLMLVGYSIDTDILLSVRVLKRKEGTIFDRTVDAFKTGIMMSLAALVAVLIAYFFTQSNVVKEIMFIIAVGLVGDIIFTWIQNAGILRWHLEKKGWK